MNKIKTDRLFKLAILLGGLSGTLLAESYTYNNTNNNNQQRVSRNNGSYVEGTSIPKAQNSKQYLYPAVVRDRFEMATGELSQTYKDKDSGIIMRKRVLSGSFDNQIAMKPEFRVLREIDTIKLSPNYIITIMFPKEMVILDAKPSFPFSDSDFDKNVLKIKPKSTFYDGNIAISLSDGKKNIYMTILASRYFQNNEEEESYLKKIKKLNVSIANKLERKAEKRKKEGFKDGYAYAKEHLSLIVKYIYPQILLDNEAMLLYERMTKTKGIDIPNGEYVSFLYNGVTYKIIRDDVQGTLIYGEKAYRVENSLQRGGL